MSRNYYGRILADTSGGFLGAVLYDERSAADRYKAYADRLGKDGGGHESHSPGHIGR